MEKYISPENILTYKQSGKDLDRLSRNKQDIKKEVEWFKAQNIRLKIWGLPTSLIEVPQGQEWILDMITNILIEVLSNMTEQERLTIRKRQQEGIEAAKLCFALKSYWQNGLM